MLWHHVLSQNVLEFILNPPSPHSSTGWGTSPTLQCLLGNPQNSSFCSLFPLAFWKQCWGWEWGDVWRGKTDYRLTSNSWNTQTPGPNSELQLGLGDHYNSLCFLRSARTYNKELLFCLCLECFLSDRAGLQLEDCMSVCPLYCSFFL